MLALYRHSDFPFCGHKHDVYETFVPYHFRTVDITGVNIL